MELLTKAMMPEMMARGPRKDRNTEEMVLPKDLPILSNCDSTLPVALVVVCSTAPPAVPTLTDEARFSRLVMASLARSTACGTSDVALI
jgi:hypothetical protein